MYIGMGRDSGDEGFGTEGKISKRVERTGSDGDASAAGQQMETPQEIKVPCMVMSRIVGYISETALWNKSKAHEFSVRRTYRTAGTQPLENPDASPK